MTFVPLVPDSAVERAAFYDDVYLAYGGPETNSLRVDAALTIATAPLGLGDTMSEQPHDDPFEDCEFSPDAILGARTFEDVLFTDESETPVDVLTGETPEHSRASVDEARAFAEGIDTDTPRIALPASVESQIETASKPYTAAAFFNFKAAGSLERHRAYHGAYELDAFDIQFEADYETGDLTITVDRDTKKNE